MKTRHKHIHQTRHIKVGYVLLILCIIAGLGISGFNGYLNFAIADTKPSIPRPDYSLVIQNKDSISASTTTNSIDQTNPQQGIEPLEHKPFMVTSVNVDPNDSIKSTVLAPLSIKAILSSEVSSPSSVKQEAAIEYITSTVTSTSIEKPIRVKAEHSSALLVIVIDDLGYIKRDLQVLDLPVTVAILPTGPYATERAELAFANRREVLIHLPMLPFNHKNLEVNTLRPEMSEVEMAKIIEQAKLIVPHAVGINNHTGSEMTASLDGMKRVFQALTNSPLFFLDSLTTGKSQVRQAALIYNHPTLVRDVFLDNIQTEEAVSKQLDIAIATARKQGHAIAIGHPHQATINVLKRRLPNLPKDVQLVTLSELFQNSNL